MRHTSVRVALTLALTGLASAYLVWKIDVSQTADELRDARLGWLALALAIMVVTVVPMAWRWQRLLAAKGMHDRLRWLLRAYFVAYTAGQVLPTSIGGDAVRILETSKRHPGNLPPITGSVLLERALGGSATLLLGAFGFALAIGRYDVGAYLWIELGFVLATVVLAVVFFARFARPWLARLAPPLRWLRVERPARGLYEGIHAYRGDGRLLLGVFGLTVCIQAVRILAIWMTARSVGLDLSPRLFYVMGPLFFLVMLVPFTVNGLAVREAFFVSFLGSVGVGADPAFATGFLFFLITLLLSVPGGIVLAWEGLRGGARRTSHA